MANDDDFYIECVYCGTSNFCYKTGVCTTCGGLLDMSKVRMFRYDYDSYIPPDDDIDVLGHTFVMDDDDVAYQKVERFFLGEDLREIFFERLTGRFYGDWAVIIIVGVVIGGIIGLLFIYGDFSFEFGPSYLLELIPVLMLLFILLTLFGSFIKFERYLRF